MSDKLICCERGLGITITICCERGLGITITTLKKSKLSVVYRLKYEQVIMGGLEVPIPLALSSLLLAQHPHVTPNVSDYALRHGHKYQ